jgi:hypothetical protein
MNRAGLVMPMIPLPEIGSDCEICRERECGRFNEQKSAISADFFEKRRDIFKLNKKAS